MKKDRLNICVVQPNKYAYSETFIRNHIEHLPANTYNTYGEWWPEFDGQHYPLREGYIQRNLFSIFISYTCKFLPTFIFNRIPPVITGLPLRNSDLLRQSFKHYLKHKKIDVVLAEYGMTGTIVMDICKELDIPLVVHFHGYDAHNANILLEYSEKYNEMFQQASAIISVSEYMQKALVEMKAPTNKTYLIRCGVDTSFFVQGYPLLSEKVLISVGRFVDTKAPHLTIMAFEKAVKIIPEAKLIMIGEGPLLDSSKTLANVLDLNNSIEFRGIQTPAQVASAMQQARAFVLHSIVTSYGDAEGTPVAILEAASSGLPVISTFHAGIPDIIQHGQSGFLVKEKDVNAMAEYMIVLLKDKELAARMGKAGRKFIEQNLSLQQQISKLMDVIIKSVADKKN